MYKHNVYMSFFPCSVNKTKFHLVFSTVNVIFLRNWMKNESKEYHNDTKKNHIRHTRMSPLVRHEVVDLVLDEGGHGVGVREAARRVRRARLRYASTRSLLLKSNMKNIYSLILCLNIKNNKFKII